MRFADFRTALRLARRSPGLTLTVVLTLGLGISVLTAVFGIVNAIWLRPLPYPQADRLVGVQQFQERVGEIATVPADRYDAWQRSTPSFEAMGACAERAFAFAPPGGEAERVLGLQVSSSLLAMLGARPIAGRTLAADDEAPAARPVALISQRFGQLRFASPADAVGRVIRLDGTDRVIVGVLPFDFKVLNSGYQVFAPLGASSLPADASLQVVGRLREGVTSAQAGATLAAVRGSAPATGTGEEEPRPLVRSLQDVVWGHARPLYLMLLAACGLLLVLVIANVSNLLLARAIARRAEFAVRLALGAGRRGVLGQLLAEGLVLALTSGTLAFLLCAALRQLLVAAYPEMSELRVDGRVAVFSFGMSGLAGLLLGCLPAAVVWRRAERFLLARSSASLPFGRHGLGRVLASAQLAVGATLLVAGGLLLKSAATIRTVDPGFDTSRLLTASVSVVREADEGWIRLVRGLEPALAQAPGVRGVALTSVLPLDGGVRTVRLEVEGRSSTENIRAAVKAVSGGYFAVLGIPTIAGTSRLDDPAGSPGTVVLNSRLARAITGGDGAAVGMRIRVDGGNWQRVTGVVADVRQDLTEPASSEIYQPLDPTAQHAVRLVIRTAAADPASAAPAVRRTARALDPDVPVSELWSMASIVDSYFSAPIAGAFGLLAVVSLLLGLMGLYGVLAFVVAQRTREFGIRAALGASRGRVIALVLRDGVQVAATGTTIGLAGAFLLGRALSGRFFGLPAFSLDVYAVIVCGLLALALLASMRPALSATRVSPSVALRQD